MTCRKKIERVGLLLVVVALASRQPAFAAKGGLDGRTFTAEAGEKGKPANEKDEIIFKDGTFRSTACDVYGFGAAPYKVTASSGGTVTFEVVTTSVKEGTMSWKGTVKGEALEGTFVWTKAGQASIDYWVKGRLKKSVP